MQHLLSRKPSAPYVVSFLTTIIGGYLFHLYAFTNMIPNSDGIGRMYDTQDMTVSGRWFLQYATFPNGFLQMPAFIALLSLLFLGCSAVLLVHLLDINHRYLAGSLGLCFITFPSLGFTFLYTFTASAYAIGVFLSIFSLYLLKQEKKWSFPVASFCLACAMGIYQAYVSFAIGLSVILVIKKALSNQETQVTTTKYGITRLAFLTVSTLLYYGILQVILMLTGQELLSYLGMNESYPISALPSLILATYKQVILFFFRSGSGTSTFFLACCNILVLLLGIMGLYFMLKDFVGTSQQQWRIVYTVLLCGLLPLALGFVQIISPWSAPSPLMQYPYVLAYLVVLFFIDHGILKCPVQYKQNCAFLVLFQFFLISLGSAWLCNVLYTASAQAHRATESYATRIMTHIEMTEGYYWGMPVVIIGAFPEDRFYTDIPSYALIDHYSAPTNSVLPLNKHIYYYFNHWLHLPIDEPSEELMISTVTTSTFQSMPLYPDYGSVAIVNDTMVVKIAETYVPKSDYELAYEASRK